MLPQKILKFRSSEITGSTFSSTNPEKIFFKFLPVLKKYDHVSGTLKSIKWLNLSDKLLFCLKNLSPGQTLSIGSLRYGDYGLRTTAGRALSFVCSTGLSRANIER